MKRKFRLTRSTEIRRVRKDGKSYAHPLVVLVVLNNDSEHTSFAVSAGKNVGNAVQRNRAKRLLRAGLQPFLESIEPGWNAVLIARKPVVGARYRDVQDALRQLLQRAAMLGR